MKRLGREFFKFKLVFTKMNLKRSVNAYVEILRSIRPRSIHEWVSMLGLGDHCFAFFWYKYWTSKNLVDRIVYKY